jgi:hypothetical protein
MDNLPILFVTTKSGRKITASNILKNNRYFVFLKKRHARHNSHRKFRVHPEG